MDELSGQQIDELAEELRKLQKELQVLLSVSKDGAKPVALELPIGRLSRMDAMQQQSMAAANRRSLQLRLQLVSVALSAHGAGDYGYCRSCDEPIGYRRLKARPETPLCVVCQAARERKA